MAEQFTDLIEIIVHVDLEGVRARREKYKTKRTASNFIPQRLTDEEHDLKGYSHRLSHRVPVDQLMQVQAIGFGDGSDHVYRHGYCLKDGQKTLFDAIRAEIQEKLTRMRANAIKLNQVWKKDTGHLKERPCRS